MDNKTNQKFVDYNIKNGHNKYMFEDDEDQSTNQDAPNGSGISKFLN